MRSNGRKLLLLPLAAALLLSLFPMSASAASDGDVLQDNFVRITTAHGFSKGTLQSLAVSTDYGDGALTLTDGATDGTYESAELAVPAFEYLVASWSADTPEGTYIEVAARAYVDLKSAWSSWLSWGKWSPYIKRASTDQKDALARIDTDTFTVLGSNGETASKIQLRVTLHTDDPAVTPVFRELCSTMKNTLEGQAIPIWHGDAEMALPASVLISDAPAISQMVRDSSIADSICSPTTVTMILNTRGENLLPEEVALREYDFYYEGFGNWPFTVALAGSYGYTGYCHYADLDFVRQELASGRTVGLSVQYSNSPDGAYPYLENAAISGTAGHLISIVGYGTESGVDYFYSNDSAAGTDSACALRKYKADQLDGAWVSRLCYVVSNEKEAGAGFAAPQRIEATLEYAGEEGVYNILVDGQPISGLSKNFSAKTVQLGAGTALLISDDAADTSGEGTASCLATHEMQYLTVTGSGQLRVGDSPAGTVYIIVNNGPTYVARFDPAASTAPDSTGNTTTQPETDTSETATPPDITGTPENSIPAVASWRTWAGVAVIVIGLAALAGWRRRDRVSATTARKNRHNKNK